MLVLSAPLPVMAAFALRALISPIAARRGAAAARATSPAAAAATRGAAAATALASAAAKGGDFVSLEFEAKTQALTESSMKLGEAMYKAQQGDGGDDAGGSGAGGQGTADDGVVDADFEEVKDDKKSA